MPIHKCFLNINIIKDSLNTCLHPNLKNFVKTDSVSSKKKNAV